MRRYKGIGQKEGKAKVQISEDVQDRFAETSASELECIKSGYYQLWLFAMRHWPELSGISPRKDRKAQKVKTNACEKWWPRLGLLAYQLGFDSPEISRLREQSPDWIMSNSFLDEARPQDSFEVDGEMHNRVVQGICNILNLIKPREVHHSLPKLTTDTNEAPPEQRCGRPFDSSQQRDSKHLFLNHIYQDQSELCKDYISSFAVKAQVFLAFFGHNTPLFSVFTHNTQEELPATQQLPTAMDIDTFSTNYSSSQFRFESQPRNNNIPPAKSANAAQSLPFPELGNLSFLPVVSGRENGETNPQPRAIPERKNGETNPQPPAVPERENGETDLQPSAVPERENGETDLQPPAVPERENGKANLQLANRENREANLWPPAVPESENGGTTSQAATENDSQPNNLPTQSSEQAVEIVNLDKNLEHSAVMKHVFNRLTPGNKVLVFRHEHRFKIFRNGQGQQQRFLDEITDLIKQQYCFAITGKDNGRLVYINVKETEKEAVQHDIIFAIKKRKLGEGWEGHASALGKRVADGEHHSATQSKGAKGVEEVIFSRDQSSKGEKGIEKVIFSRDQSSKGEKGIEEVLSDTCSFASSL
jgi:hypothetical protein